VKRARKAAIGAEAAVRGVGVGGGSGEAEGETGCERKLGAAKHADEKLLRFDLRSHENYDGSAAVVAAGIVCAA